MVLCAIFDLSLNIASGLPAVGHGLRESNNLEECKCGRKQEVFIFIYFIYYRLLSLSQALPLTFTVQQLFFYIAQCSATNFSSLGLLAPFTVVHYECLRA